MTPLDLNIIIPAIVVAVPGTIAALAALQNGRKMKTNGGQRPGEYIESTAAAAYAQSVKLDQLEARQTATHDTLADHIIVDQETRDIVGGLEKTLAAQERRAAVVKTDLEAAAAHVRSDLKAEQAHPTQPKETPA